MDLRGRLRCSDRLEDAKPCRPDIPCTPTRARPDDTATGRLEGEDDRNAASRRCAAATALATPSAHAGLSSEGVKNWNRTAAPEAVTGVVKLVLDGWTGR